MKIATFNIKGTAFPINKFKKPVSTNFQWESDLYEIKHLTIVNFLSFKFEIGFYKKVKNEK